MGGNAHDPVENIARTNEPPVGSLVLCVKLGVAGRPPRSLQGV